MVRTILPAHLMSTLAEWISQSETHASMDSLFMYADAPGDPPEGSKKAKALEWLRRTNKDESVDPILVAGKLIEQYMEPENPIIQSGIPWKPNEIEKYEEDRKASIQIALERAGFLYSNGGRLSQKVSLVSEVLADHIRNKAFGPIEDEFHRALENANSKPREAVSAACNILESVCKIYIDDEGLPTPKKQDLNGVWQVVKKDLNLDNSIIQDRDLQEIISGIFAAVNGIGALRTHVSSAHGAGKKTYRLQSRHVRLAVNAAHTLVLFILESWEYKKSRANK